MAVLIIGLIVFLGVHSVGIVAPAWRERTAASFGEQRWRGVYSLLALVGFVLIVYGYGLARQRPVVLYAPPFWTRHLTMLLMLPVFALLVAAYVPGRIRAAMKHPMLVAVKLWAVAHLIANGMLADVVLFGSFLVWAVADRISVKHRPPKALPGPASRPYNDLIVVVVGLVLYAAFVLWLHRWLIGVPVMPGLAA